VEHGVFATRSPNRPNPISLSLVDVIDITGNTIRVRGLEALDGTPVLDIKPYSREIDCPE
jgi:formylmethanofuran dehydrogenase subunit E